MKDTDETITSLPENVVPSKPADGEKQPEQSRRDRVFAQAITVRCPLCSNPMFAVSKMGHTMYHDATIVHFDSRNGYLFCSDCSSLIGLFETTLH